MCCCRVGNHDMLEHLLRGHGLNAQVHCVDHKGRSALFLAAQFQRYQTVRALVRYGCDLECRDMNGITPLTVAAYAGDLRLCELLLSLGADCVTFVSCV